MRFVPFFLLFIFLFYRTSALKMANQISFHESNEQDWWVVEWTFVASLGKLDN